MTVSIDEIRTMAEKDMKLDPSSLDSESLITPQIHNKYLSILLDERLTLKRYESTLKILKKNKWLYYSGKMSEEQTKELQWEPFELSLLRVDLDKFIESDQEVITLTNKVELYNEKIMYLESIIKIIANRIWTIRAAIDWMKFTQGQ